MVMSMGLERSSSDCVIQFTPLHSSVHPYSHQKQRFLLGILKSTIITIYYKLSSLKYFHGIGLAIYKITKEEMGREEVIRETT